MINVRTVVNKPDQQASLLTVSPRKFFRVLVLISVGFTVVSYSWRMLGIYGLVNSSKLARVMTKFDVNLENTFPSFYATLILLLSSFLLACIAWAASVQKGEYILHWKWLSAIFLFLATDEMLALHDSLTDYMRRVFHAGGFLFYAWVIPYAFFVVFVGLMYIRFLAHLPVRIRHLFLLSGALYVGGALGLEMVVGFLMTSRISMDSLILLAALEEHTEELLEMLGIALFIYTLLLYIRMKFGNLVVQLSDD
ncbi:hypothetical protein [Dyadobacter flavalbus]|uniref:hypothetical protein n=1 Tax=Dyadobacter flavalbus TaxID=2579942 RepID=UPI001E37EC7F|nr:hypothetical protein [Dyadobacter flavalbus]